MRGLLFGPPKGPTAVPKVRSDVLHQIVRVLRPGVRVAVVWHSGDERLTLWDGTVAGCRLGQARLIYDKSPLTTYPFPPVSGGIHVVAVKVRIPPPVEHSEPSQRASRKRPSPGLSGAPLGASNEDVHRVPRRQRTMHAPADGSSVGATAPNTLGAEEDELPIVGGSCARLCESRCGSQAEREARRRPSRVWSLTGGESSNTPGDSCTGASGTSGVLVTRGHATAAANEGGPACGCSDAVTEAERGPHTRQLLSVGQGRVDNQGQHRVVGLLTQLRTRVLGLRPGPGTPEATTREPPVRGTQRLSATVEQCPRTSTSTNPSEDR